MGEHLAETLQRCAAVLRWFEKYTESNALILLARLLRAHDVRDVDSLAAWVEREEEATAEARDDA